MAFHEVRFPTGISVNSTGGPRRKTQVTIAGSGHEVRNQQWADSRREYNAGYGVKNYDDLHVVLEFFEERRGRLHGFRWKDRGDWKSAAPGTSISVTDQSLGTGDGATVEFQLVKTYGSAYAPYTRTINKPVAGTVRVAFDGVEQLSGWAVNTATGLITFSSAPSLAVAVTAGYEFDVPVRFNSDQLSYQGESFTSGGMEIPIIEIRETT